MAPSPMRNRLLAALPAEDYSRIAADLTLRSLRAHQTLQKRGEPLREIYFPSRSLCSVSAMRTDGAPPEIAVVGSEGVIGVEGVLGLEVSSWDATVQVAGDGMGHAMDVDVFRNELRRKGTFYAHVTSYAYALVGCLAQSIKCNSLHSAQARCCRWLLDAQDRLAVNEMPLTHDALATLLAVPPPTITLVIETLVQLGLISTSHGVIRIIDRTALEAESCECYLIVKALVDHTGPASREAEPATSVRRDRTAWDVHRREALIQRVKSEFREMPGLCLTLPQVSRLLGLPEDACERILSALVADGDLRKSGNHYTVSRSDSIGPVL
jgi:CRP-like cAMP-binding protein